jgi:hypothetical protein
MEQPLTRIFGLRALFGSFLLTLPFAAAARGELITFEFSGTVTSVSVSPDYQSFDFPDVGDPFTGFYTFDSDAHDSANSPEQGTYYTVLPERAIVVSIGEIQFEGSANGILTFQNYYGVGDWIPNIEITSDPTLGTTLDHNNFSLIVRKEELFSDPNVLPLTPPSLVGAEEASLIMDLDDADDLSPFPEVSIMATLESLRIVPEPSGIALTAIVLLFLLQRRLQQR